MKRFRNKGDGVGDSMYRQFWDDEPTIYVWRLWCMALGKPPCEAS